MRTSGSSKRQRPAQYIPEPQSASTYLRLITLPNTWRGRRGERQAKELLIGQFKQDHGHEPPPHIPGQLQLFIDDRPSTTATNLYQDGIVFSRDHELGQKLWSVAHPIPWSKRSRWIRWPIYLLTVFYTSLGTWWYFGREQVPITGRWQFQCLPNTKPLPKGILVDSGFKKVIEQMVLANKDEFLANDDVLVARIRSVLDRILRASGLAHLDWTLWVMDVPGMNESLHSIDQPSQLLTWIGVLNASANPLGIIIVFKEILAAAETDNEIAAVLSHEVSHILARHKSEQDSGEILGTWVTLPAMPMFLGMFLVEDLFIVALPFLFVGGAIYMALSRSREAEADKIGMLLMTEAGFDPRAAVTFWEKMERIENKQLGTKKKPEYQSTHPHVSLVSSN
ncbi:MAG: hypothetical protein Q9219_002504 [cf. Caloplaca sp. 3 TL-2023]